MKTNSRKERCEWETTKKEREVLKKPFDGLQEAFDRLREQFFASGEMRKDMKIHRWLSCLSFFLDCVSLVFLTFQSLSTDSWMDRYM